MQAEVTGSRFDSPTLRDGRSWAAELLDPGGRLFGELGWLDS